MPCQADQVSHNRPRLFPSLPPSRLFLASRSGAVAGQQRERLPKQERHKAGRASAVMGGKARTGLAGM